MVASCAMKKGSRSIPADMNRYREYRNRTDSGKTLRQKRSRFSRSKTVESSFENYLLLGTLDSAVRNQAESLYSFIKTGNCDGLKEFLTERPEFLRLRDQLQGASLVHFAVEFDQSAIIDILVEIGASIHAGDDDGNTPLHWSAIHNASMSMLALLGHGADYKKLNNESESAVHLAVVLNRVDYFKTMLNAGYDIDIVILGPKNKTPLHYAAELDNLEMCSEIFDYGIARKMCGKQTCGNKQFRLCARDLDNNTPTHTAARAGSAKVLRLIFKGSAEHGYSNEDILGFISSESSTPLHNAVDGGHTEVIRLLIQYGADPFCTQGQLLPPFHIAASMSDARCMEVMVEEVERSKLDSKDQEGRTGLARAIVAVNMKVADILLGAGADPNIKIGVNEDTPLHIAVRLNSECCVTKLLDYGADYFSLNGNGDTILHLALRLPNINVIEKILSHEKVCTLATIRNNENMKPIQVAVRYNKLEALKQLIALAPKCSANNSPENHYLLHIAAEKGHYQMAHFLIEDNYSIGKSIMNQYNDSGLTPLHLAAIHGNIEVLKLLLKYGAILHNCPVGYTPFATAARFGYLRILQVLLESFPHAKDMCNYEGNSPLHVAASNGHAQIVNFLLDSKAGITLNNEGTTFFYDAIVHDHSNVVVVTLKHKRWQEALDVLATSQPPPFAALVIRMPALAKMVLDQSIEKSSFNDIKKGNWVKYKFKYLVPPANLPVLSKSPSLGTSGVSMNSTNEGSNSISFSISSTLRATETLFEYEKVDQMYVLDTMRKYVRRNLLGHPLVNKFLQDKWVRYGSSFYATSLSFFLVYIVLLSVFVIVYKPMYACSTPFWSSVNFSDNSTYLDDKNYYIYRGVLDAMALGYLALLIVGIFLAKHKLSYIISIHSLVELLCYVTTLVFLPLHTPCPIWGAGAFALFFGWITFLFYIGQYGIFALYTRMLLAVLKTVIFMLPLVLLLVCSFAFALYTLLSPIVVEHRSVERSLLTVFQMIIGEPGFELVTNFAYADSTEGQLPSKGTVYFFLIFAGLLMTIILTNLLIGLAVGDIANVREGAFLKRVVDRIVFFGNMDRMLPEWVKRDVKNRVLIEYPSRHRLGAISVVWKHIVELSSPNSNEESDYLGKGDDCEIASKFESNEKNFDELKDLISKQYDMIANLKKQVLSNRNLSLSLDESLGDNFN